MIKIENNRIRWALSIFLSLLILFGTYRNVFSLAAFLICGLIIAFCDKETILLQLFFVMPMANIFKLSPTVQSFFTILILAYVVLHLILPRRATFIVVLFAVYVIVGQLAAGGFDLFRTIKLIFNLLFLSSALNIEVKLRHKEIFLSYIVGNIVASTFRLLDSDFFKITTYVGIKEWADPEAGDFVVRFAGLYADPNYYTIGMIISLCLLVLLYYKNEIQPILMVLFTVPIVYFLIITYSKSAIIMVFVPFILLLYVLLKKKKYATMVSIAFFALAIVVLAISGFIPALDIVIKRFSLADTGSDLDVNALTTGRFNLWIKYGSYIISNVKTLLFGDSICADLLVGGASHNTYLDIVYHTGLLGGCLLFFSLKAILAQSTFQKERRNILSYSIIISIVILYFFVGQLFYFDPPFQIFIAFMVLNWSLKNKLTDTQKLTEQDII